MHSAHGCCPAGMENEVRCVKEEYAEEVAIGSVIWADHGSGADQDVQVRIGTSFMVLNHTLYSLELNM